MFLRERSHPSSAAEFTFAAMNEESRTAVGQLSIDGSPKSVETLVNRLGFQARLQSTGLSEIQLTIR